MYKAIIVDDESMIRNGLKTIIPWEECGFTIIADAKNAREALQRHQELAPDLLVVDIRMPGMDGLELIEEIRKTDDHCHFLILSGYADFTYAQQALTQGVDGYILKPVDEREFAEHLQRIHALLHKQSALGSNTLKQREEYIQSLLQSRKPAVEGGQSRSLAAGLLSWKSYQVILVDVTASYKDDAWRFAEARGKLVELFESDKQGYVFAAEPWIGVIIKQTVTNRQASSELYRQIKEQMNSLQLSCFAVAGQVVKRVEQLADSLSQAREVMKHKFLCDGEQVFTMHDLPAILAENEENQVATDLKQLADKLYYAMDIGKISGVELVLEQASKAFLSNDTTELTMKTNWAQLISLVLNKLSMRNNEAYLAVQSCMSLTADLYKQANYAGLLREVRSRLLQVTESMCSASNEPVLKQILDFVQNHYSDNLKLETLAEMFNYNSGYLGKMFRKYTGEPFHTYLDKIRIEKATELLGQGLKVHQVAERIGYANVDYFHTKFKRYSGVSPSYYKVKTTKPSPDDAGGMN
ncbi:response regulator transcription factor [Paenibacillus radicis (ex Xue et al. 2023)]|uniref:Response regulator transcription factor n=1 Tax=Paenibacillus radicis (ex Xue et al. 2023) TaxID=2972489 RepID=A0ABT1YBK6_9BACL|nr:response regulator transcription factor [Paenibacillus radicis (ex Xue et al. 2023)]MCR8630573.1 response regulator transcription factor [Paenibacillus radicis (ex Xue et al. 2023)]